jgi:uncharacterized protein YnzC (UPF0291/DUF896 family)
LSVSVETQLRISELREKARNGTLTVEECKEAINFLRQERLAMPQSSAKSRTKAPPPNADDLLKDLGI